MEFMFIKHNFVLPVIINNYSFMIAHTVHCFPFFKAFNP